MEANKTISHKKAEFFSDNKEEIQKGQINLLGLKGMEVKRRTDPNGFTYSLPAVSIEGYSVDSVKGGQNEAIFTMLSKAPEMLELLLKTKEKLETDIKHDSLVGAFTKDHHKLLAEIDAVLRHIID